MERAGARSCRNCDIIDKRVPTVAVDVEEPRWWDSDDETDRVNEKCWRMVLGGPVSSWKTVELTKSSSYLLVRALGEAEVYKRNVEEYFDKIEKLNEMINEDEKFTYVAIRPRFPRPRCFYPWYKMYRMKNTNPSCVTSKRFTDPSVSEYMAAPMLQFLSLRFAGDFSCDNHMSVYGFLAVRDDIDYLRNHVFHISREHAHEISLDSRSLPLISPTRGIRAKGVLVEYSITAKNNATEYEENDYEIIDGCFEFRNLGSMGNEKHKVRIYGQFGPMDIGFVFIMRAVEATIDVKIIRAAKDYDLKTVTAFTSGYHDGIVLYDSRSTVASNNELPLLVVASSVVAVQLDSELKLTFDFGAEDVPGHGFHNCSGKRGSKGSMCTRELCFTAKKHKSSVKAIALGGMFKLVANVTWSTFGPDTRLPRWSHTR